MNDGVKISLIERLARIESKIESACQSAGRTRDDMTLVAVSKNHPVSAIKTLYEEGVRDFGESYIQEWQTKKSALPDDIRWHFIGHLQSNKAKYLSDQVALIHGVDRMSLIKSLQKSCENPVDVLLQVNIANESSKSGVDVDDVAKFVEEINQRSQLRLRGLMTIPPMATKPEDNDPYFQSMGNLLDMIVQTTNNASEINILSMGMSSDFEAAIHAGATHIRVGTALFGPRG